MTPEELARDPARATEFLRDVVGYETWPGDGSRLEDFLSLTPERRKLVLAWFWPHSGYAPDFDPIDEFRSLERDRSAEQLRQLLRAEVGARALSFVVTTAAATRQPVDEVLAASCWLTTCAGQDMLGVLDGTRGLTFEQIVRFTDALGLRYVDPLDDAAQLHPWPSVVTELRARVIDALVAVTDGTLAAAGKALVDRARHARETAGSRGMEEALRGYEGFLPGLSTAISDATDAELVVRARAALEDLPAGGVARLSRFVTALALGTEHENFERSTRLLDALLADVEEQTRSTLLELLALAAPGVSGAVLVDREARQGHGWLILERGATGTRIGEAVAALESITAARATLKKRFAVPDTERPPAPGTTFVAPAPGSRYRALYEALATADELPSSLRVDPETCRIHTPTRGWLPLPPSAVRDRAWWSGTAKSAPGRPQVMAWHAAGLGSPRLEQDAEDRIVAARFSPLPGRDKWLTVAPETRLTLGRYSVPPLDNAPFHAVLSYPERAVWHMAQEEASTLRGLRLSTRAPERSTEPAAERSGHASPTDEDRMDELVAMIRRQGEMTRAEIENGFRASGSPLGVTEIETWLSRVLARARRQGRIANIGSRKQPRWVEVGSSAHLAARLTRVLEKDRDGARGRRLTPPRLSPGEPVPADLYREVVRHAFADEIAGEPQAGEPLASRENGQTFLTRAGMRAVLAGRRLTAQGIEALLTSVRLKEEAAWEAAAAAAGALDQGSAKLDERSLLELLEED